MRARRLIGVSLLVAVALAFGSPSAFADTTREHPYNKGCAQLRKGDLDAAERSFKFALKLNPKDTDARNNLAVVYLRQEKYEEALKELRQVLRTNPRYRGAELNVGGGYLLQGKADEAFPPTRDATMGGVGSSAQKVRELAYHNLGLISAANGDYASAYAWFAKAGKDDSTRVCAAAAQCAAGDPAKGITTLEQVSTRDISTELRRRVDHNLQIAYYRRGLLAMADKRFDDARADFDKSTKVAPNAYAHLGLALLDAESGELEKANDSLVEIGESNAPQEVKSAAKTNLGRLVEFADKRSAWLKWLTIPMGLLAIAAVSVSLAAIIKAPSWYARLKPLRITLGVVFGLLAVAMILSTWGDPFRTFWWLAGWTVAALALSGWVFAGSVRRA